MQKSQSSFRRWTTSWQWHSGITRTRKTDIKRVHLHVTCIRCRDLGWVRLRPEPFQHKAVHYVVISSRCERLQSPCKTLFQNASVDFGDCSAHERRSWTLRKSVLFGTLSCNSCFLSERKKRSVCSERTKTTQDVFCCLFGTAWATVGHSGFLASYSCYEAADPVSITLESRSRRCHPASPRSSHALKAGCKRTKTNSSFGSVVARTPGHVGTLQKVLYSKACQR